MMDFSQVVYDRLSDETLENDGEALFEQISSYGRSFITMKVQAVDDEGNKVALYKSVSPYTWFQPNNVSNGQKHMRTHEHDERIIAVREEPILHCVLPERCPG